MKNEDNTVMWMFLPYLLALLCAGYLLRKKETRGLLSWAVFAVVTALWYLIHLNASAPLGLMF